MFKKGLIQCYQLLTGTIVVKENSQEEKPRHVILYARVSSSENKSNLDSQVKRLIDFASAKGYTIDEVVKECVSGLNDKRPKLCKILSEGKVTTLIVERADRLTRFGFNYLEILCKHIDCELIVINKAETEQAYLLQDFISITTSFCARIYRQRRSKRKTEKIIKELNEND